MAWSTLSNIYDDVRFKTNKTSDDLSDATLLRLANKTAREIYVGLIGTSEDWYGEIAEFDLVASTTAANREYTIPADSASTPWGGGAIKILQVELKIDGTNWTVARPAKLSGSAIPYNESDITANYDNNAPFYAVFDNSIFILSGTTTAVTDGGRIFYIKRPAEMTTGTDVPDMPNEFLTVLSTGMTRDVYERDNNIERYQIAVQQFRQQQAQLLSDQEKRNPQMPHVLTSSYENFGDTP